MNPNETNLRKDGDVNMPRPCDDKSKLTSPEQNNVLSRGETIPTPITDAAAGYVNNEAIFVKSEILKQVVDIKDARSIERQLVEAQKRIKLLEEENAQNNSASVIFDLCMCKSDRDQLTQQVVELKEVLEILAHLGNGDKYGNSEGNCIAQKALSKPTPSSVADLELIRRKAKALDLIEAEGADVKQSKHSTNWLVFTVKSQWVEASTLLEAVEATQKTIES